MPVLIVGASCDVGRRLASILRADDAQVRVYLTEDDPGFRASGCKVAIGELDDIGRIESAMEQVHTVVLLTGEPEAPRGRSIAWLNEEVTDVVVRAAVSADVVRLLALSTVRADPSSPNDYLSARGRSDALVEASGLEWAVLRCAPILGSDSALTLALREARRARVAAVIGSGMQRLNPVWSGDVARALSLLDERAHVVGGIYELGGPETVTFEQLVRLVAPDKRVVHRRSLSGVPKLLSAQWASDTVASSDAFVGQFGLELSGLSRAIEASVEKSAS